MARDVSREIAVNFERCLKLLGSVDFTQKGSGRATPASILGMTDQLRAMLERMIRDQARKGSIEKVNQVINANRDEFLNKRSDERTRQLMER